MNTSFTHYLQNELTSAKCALLTLYEKRDHMRYIMGPDLEQEYMEKIGSFEETVVMEEIECELLRKKKQLIQTAVNRCEPINEAAIDAQIEKLRQEKYVEAAGNESNQNTVALSAEDAEEMKRLYHLIVRDFHPQGHNDLTDAQRQLFEKAQEAYKNKNLDSLRLIYEMLENTREDDGNSDRLLSLLAAMNYGEEEPQNTRKTESREVDYGLVSEIYCCFKPTATEISLWEEWQIHWREAQDLLEEVKGKMQQFPFSAAEMLSDPAKVEQYRDDLDHRLRNANEERKKWEQDIRALMEREVTRG